EHQDVSYSLVDRASGHSVAKETFRVVVLPTVKLELQRVETTRTIIAGDRYEATIRVINRGNAPLEVRLTATASPTGGVQIEDTSFELEAASWRPINVSFGSKADLRRQLTQVIKISARAADPDGTTVTAAQTLAVDIIPRITGDTDPFSRLPARLR